MNTTLERAAAFVGDMPDGDQRLIESWVEKMAEFADKETAALKAKLDAVQVERDNYRIVLETHGATFRKNGRVLTMPFYPSEEVIDGTEGKR